MDEWGSGGLVMQAAPSCMTPNDSQFGVVWGRLMV